MCTGGVPQTVAIAPIAVPLSSARSRSSGMGSLQRVVPRATRVTALCVSSECSARSWEVMMMMNYTPLQVKCELGRMRAGTGAFPAPCSDRHLQGATGVLLSGFRFFASSDSRCQTRLLGAFCRQARLRFDYDSSQPRAAARGSCCFFFSQDICTHGYPPTKAFYYRGFVMVRARSPGL